MIEMTNYMRGRVSTVYSQPILGEPAHALSWQNPKKQIWNIITSWKLSKRNRPLKIKNTIVHLIKMKNGNLIKHFSLNLLAIILSFGRYQSVHAFVSSLSPCKGNQLVIWVKWSRWWCCCWLRQTPWRGLKGWPWVGVCPGAADQHLLQAEL